MVMLFPQVSAREWMKNHPDLKSFNVECQKCNKRRRASIPFVTHRYFGLKAPDCKCGNKTFVAIGVTRTREEYLRWEKCFRNNELTNERLF